MALKILKNVGGLTYNGLSTTRIDKILNTIAKKGANTAKEILDTASEMPIEEYNQQFGNAGRLSSCIRVEKTGHLKYAVIAEATNAEKAYNLYYSEYGAGLTAEQPLGSSSGYEPHGKTRKGDSWTYVDQFTKQINTVDHSVPLHYMRTAREVMRNEIINSTLPSSFAKIPKTRVVRWKV